MQRNRSNCSIQANSINNNYSTLSCIGKFSINVGIKYYIIRVHSSNSIVHFTANQLNTHTAHQLNTHTANELNTHTANQLNTHTAHQLNTHTAQNVCVLRET